jgi:hypothetical protein
MAQEASVEEEMQPLRTQEVESAIGLPWMRQRGDEPEGEVELDVPNAPEDEVELDIPNAIPNPSTYSFDAPYTSASPGLVQPIISDEFGWMSMSPEPNRAFDLSLAESVELAREATHRKGKGEGQ